MKILEILVVEDEPSNREIAEICLTSLGHQVTTCENGQQALDLMLVEDRRFDIILMDVLTPVLDGLAATMALRKDSRTKDVAVVCVSARASGSDESAGLKAGCDVYLKKPYHRRDLLRAMTEALIKRGVLRPGEELGQAVVR